MAKPAKDGGVIGFQGKKGLAKVSDLEHQREYLKTKIDKPIRSRELRGYDYGEDPDEQRAANVQGTILERIVYKKLSELLGPEGGNWQFQYGINGARVFKGGFVLDFIIFLPKLIALEVQGEHWHTALVAWRDVARALSVMAEGYEYVEILEWEIWAGDQYLEFKLRQLLGL